MGLEIHLLGRPRVQRDGAARPAPRGRKAWGLLAYLLRGEKRPSRQHLASLLFDSTDDPLGSLRWNLAQLRRLLGPDVLGDKAIELELPPDAFVDVFALTQAPPLEAVAVPGLGRELLEDMDFGASPAFEAWLLLERRTLVGAAEEALREAALGHLAAGDHGRGIELAARLVAVNPYDENFQELLIRGYATSGDRDAAASQLGACVQLFRRELGRDPATAVFRAAQPQPDHEPAAPVSGREAVRARLEAGRSAVDAGVVDSGLHTLGVAVTEAHACADQLLEGQAQLAFGTALVHAARGRDEEGSGALVRAVELAAASGDRATGAAALRELGYVEALRGRYTRCVPNLREAAALADSDEERAGIAAILGMAAADVGLHDRALEHLERSIELAEGAASAKQLSYSLALAGRSRLLREEWDAARTALQRALEIAERDWTTFVPWPESLLAEVELRTGGHESARQRFEHAYALGCQIGDPCWEGLSARGLGLVAAGDGDGEGAIERLELARRRAGSLPDAYLWVEAYALDGLCEVAVRWAPGRLAQWSSELRALAGRTGMRELSARAYLHQAAAGDGRATEIALLLTRAVENPRLRDRAGSGAPA